ncbi:hypothetical protein EON65_12165 [archaeon]|nr:MAG: hypothetical protein EON65_12165 [archaeon]
MFAQLFRKNRSEDHIEAVRLLSRKSLFISEQSVTALRRIVIAMLSYTREQEEHTEYTQTLSLLRDVLYKLCNTHSNNKFSSDLLEMLMCVHYTNLFYVCTQNGMKEQAAKVSITLLKYITYIPADKAYYKAGIACKDGGNLNLAFLLLNRYVDIAEAMDTADLSLLSDSAELNEADALPNIEALAGQHYLGHEVISHAILFFLFAYLL